MKPERKAAIEADYSKIVTENWRREQEAREAERWHAWERAEPPEGADIEEVRDWANARPDKVKPRFTGSADGGRGVARRERIRLADRAAIHPIHWT